MHPRARLLEEDFKYWFCLGLHSSCMAGQVIAWGGHYMTPLVSRCGYTWPALDHVYSLDLEFARKSITTRPMVFNNAAYKGDLKIHLMPLRIQ